MRKFAGLAVSLVVLAGCTDQEPPAIAEPSKSPVSSTPDVDVTSGNVRTRSTSPPTTEADTDGPSATPDMCPEVAGVELSQVREDVAVAQHAVTVVSAREKADDADPSEEGLWRIDLHWTNRSEKIHRYEGVQWGTWHEGHVVDERGNPVAVVDIGYTGETAQVYPGQSLRTWMEFRIHSGESPGWIEFDVKKGPDVVVLLSDNVEIDALELAMQRLGKDEETSGES